VSAPVNEKRRRISSKIAASANVNRITVSGSAVRGKFYPPARAGGKANLSIPGGWHSAWELPIDVLKVIPNRPPAHSVRQ
jgi:hypothetical protein